MRNLLNYDLRLRPILMARLFDQAAQDPVHPIMIFHQQDPSPWDRNEPPS
jgi:hypothetical protein